MKRIITAIFTILVLSSLVFSEGFFSKNRFLEIKAGTTVGLSNNILSAPDYMKKDLVIDLRKIADQCPQNGFQVLANLQPEAAMKISIKSISVGFSIGAELYENMNIDRSLFEFLGYGNSLGQNITAAIKNETELFAYAKVDVGFNLRRLRFSIQPSIFVPLVEIKGNGGTVTAVNDAAGNLNINADLNMEVYTPFDISFDQDGKIKINTDSLEKCMFSGYGFDVSAALSIPFTKTFSIEADARVPLVPGRIKKKYLVTGAFSLNSPVMQLGNNQIVSETPHCGDAMEADFVINRPFKVHAYLGKSFLNNLLFLRAGGGICVRRPLLENSIFYPEYYVGLELNFVNMLKFCVSTQYTDQIFIHQIGSTINIRVLQLDLGASIQSADLKKSFAFSGLGLYAYVTVGL